MDLQDSLSRRGATETELRQACEELERLRALCARAAYALEFEDTFYNPRLWDLIALLRKAAE